MADFDAIVVGSGMSGGMAAKELCERGLKVLVLERGPEIVPERDYTDQLTPWQTPNLDQVPQDEIAEHYPRQYGGVAYAIKESTKHFWVKDDEHPYETDGSTDYDWLRGYHTAGRSIMWSRQTYRWGPQDFEANKQDGHGIDWPVRYDDIAPWYDKVETFIGVSGQAEGLPQLPDSVFQPAFELTDAEKAFKARVETAFPGRTITSARIAHLTDATEEQRSLGRSNCQARNRCHHGCTFKAYFSSLNATLPAAQRTGNLTMVHNAIVQALDYDGVSNRISGVRIVDAESNERRTYTARLIFLNASAIASAMILLQSKSERFPNGLANDSDQVGRNLMDHVSAAGISGTIAGFENLKVFGRRPGGMYIPRYANITEPDKPYLRGFGFQGSASPVDNAGGQIPGIGRAFKEAHRRPGPWRIGMLMFGEQLPNPENRVRLHPSARDRWGNPLPLFNVSYSDNERIMMEEARKDGVAMLDAAGCTDIVSNPNATLSKPGNRIHEMGTARMGRDPATSVLNGWCQAHAVPNLFITDGAFMASAACQNPSLTYMAFTARSADYATQLLAEGTL
ncbi:MAG: GMC family oxidoreductase [Pseudohongiellaceae bacterium]